MFGDMVAASRAYREGAGAVLFPEQLSVTIRPAHQSFGVVFLSRLQTLLRPVVPLLEPGTLGDDPDLLRLRREAFLAHERGHLQGMALETVLPTRSKRLAAVISELHADLDALLMLLSTSTEHALAVASVLVADRVMREAWLLRPHAQVDAIAARHLLGLLSRAGAIVLTDEGRVALDLLRSRACLTEEWERVRALEQDCVREGVAPARDYLQTSGWEIIGSSCHREITSPLGQFLACSAVRRQ
ncbi:hypothetical protein GCM10009551_057490 [Nocardiopsis tropica]